MRIKIFACFIRVAKDIFINIKISYLLVAVAYLIATLIFLRYYLMNPGFIGHNWDWHYPTSSIYYYFGANREIQAWDYDDLGFAKPYGYSIPRFLTFMIGMFIEPGLLQRILLIGVPTFASFNAFVLLNYLGSMYFPQSDRRIRFLSSVIAGALYGFGPAVFYMLLAGSITVLYGVALFPLSLYSMIRFCYQPNLRSLIFMYLINLFLAITSISVTLLVFLVFGLFSVITRINIKLAIFTYVPSIAFYLGYFFPLLFYWDDFKSNINAPLTIINVPSPILSFWQMDIYRRTTYINSVPEAFRSSYLIFVLLLLILLFLPLLILRLQNRIGIFGYLSYIIFLGWSTPAFSGQVLPYIYKIPFFSFLRSLEYFSLPTTLSLSVILFSVFLSVFSRQHSIIRRIYVIILVILIALSLFPWYTGDLGLTERSNMDDSTLDLFHVTPAYTAALNYIAHSNKTGYVLPIPMTLLPKYIPTDYQRINHKVPAWGEQQDLFNSPWGVITNDPAHVRYPYIYDQKNYLIRSKLTEIVYSQTLDKYPYLLGIFNIAYIMVFNNTFVYPPPAYPGYKAMIHYLSNLTFLKPLIVSDSVSLYEVLEPYYKPRVYLLTNYNLTIQSQDLISEILSNTELQNYSSEANSNMLICDKSSENENATVTVNYESPTLYKLRVTTDGPFYLVLTQSYDPRWTLEIIGQSTGVTYHEPVYGFANGWCVNVPKGDYEIILYYRGQDYIVQGLLLSLLMIVGSFISIWYFYFKTKNWKKRRE